ncbi:FAD/NAD(P)-binding protein [Macrococcus equipercicus]|nr:FAD/NAD(P)-binding protein [Macrococcus equipercicus]
MKIAVIGGGIAGYHVINYLMKSKQQKRITVTLFDDKTHLGRGRAFQEDDPELLLNYPSNLISLKKNKPDDFYQWVKTQSLEDIREEGDNRDEEGNIYFSRRLFGDYVQHKMQQLTANSNVTVITERVSTVKRTGRRWTLTAGDKAEQFDYVFLVPGQLPALDPYRLTGTAGYIGWLYPLDQLAVHPDKTYAVIGSGLSGLDCIRYLTDKGVNTVTVASRSGQVQAVRGQMKTYRFKYFTTKTFDKIKRKHDDQLPLEELIHVFKKECDYQGVDYARWFNVNRSRPKEALKHDISSHKEIGGIHSILYQMQHHGFELWPYMTRRDKAIFLAEYEPLLKENMNPMPESSGEELLALLEDNRTVIKGGLHHVEYKYRKYRLQYEDGTEDRVHYVINATGPAKHIHETDAGELVETLLDDSLIAENPYGGIQVMPHDNRVISPKYGVMDNLMVLGQMTGGVNYGNNGVYELLLEAKRVVKYFYSRL